jgi:hypothetical protein
MIKIPLITPLGRTVNTVGIWMSGGADSSILCYLLAKKIKEEKLPIKLKPLTVQKQHGVFGFLAVTEKIIELLDAKELFENQTVYPAPTNGWIYSEYQAIYATKNKENIKNNEFQILFSGITTNPPKEVQHGFKWGVLQDVENIRAEGKEKEKTRYFTVEHESKNYEFYEIKPFFDLNKKSISNLYKEHGLLETLFPLTRSCEDPELSVGHCGKCWWCEERFWAFGRLE